MKKDKVNQIISGAICGTTFLGLSITCLAFDGDSITWTQACTFLAVFGLICIGSFVINRKLVGEW